MSAGPLSVSIHQGLLEKCIRLIFPDAKIYVESKKQSNLKYPATGNYLELDVYLPELHIGLEFQDTYHYISTWYAQRTLEKISRNDNIKKRMIHTSGISLIEVPCWWDGEVASLVATLQFFRPDLQLTPLTSPISMNPPPKFFPSSELPEVGELMLASFPMDVEFADTIDHNTWWMGEKYDGIRCCWGPKNRIAYSRAGNEIVLHSSIKALLPATTLDAEFWFGRGLFSNAFLLVKGNVDFVHWTMLKLIAFDVPSYNFQNKPFEKRYKHLLRRIKADDPFTVIASRALCKSSIHLNISIAGIILDGGEGVILRKVGSMYEHGRSRDLVKLKSAFGDKEGLVVAVTSDYVTLKLPNSQLFDVPMKSVHIPTPTKGDIVTFSYEIHSRRDLPVNAEVYRVRSDLSWEDVLVNSMKEPKSLNEQSQVFTEHPRGYWNHETMRAFMENVARKHYMDPHDPDTWYTLPSESIYQSKTGRTILHKFKAHHIVLQELFPEIQFDNSILLASWSELSHRRKFFEKYAYEYSFDPLIPENWYAQPKDRIMATKGIRIVLSYHNDSLAQALVDIFHDIDLDPSKLPTKSFWSDISHRQQFFETYAKDHGFDPLIPKNWYTQSKENIMATKGATNVMYHHLNNIPRALSTLFPTMQIEKSKFWRRTPYYLVEIRRKFFEDYAKVNKFDPLIAENWYSQPRKKIMVAEGASNVMFYHQGSVSRALRSLFPDIGIDRNKLWQQASWNDSADRRKFFENYAKDHSFDPLIPENWYSVPRHKIMAVKGGEAVISYHGGSIARALQELFPDVDIERQRFWAQASWKKRRRYFENYARECGFDLLVPENWYTQPRSKIMATEWAKWVVSYHKGSVARALQNLFPEIEIDRKKFKFSRSSSPSDDLISPDEHTSSPFTPPLQSTSPLTSSQITPPLLSTSLLTSSAGPEILDLSNLLSSPPFLSLSPLERAVTLVRDYKLSQKRAARVCEVGARAVHAALDADKKGRPVGVPGRPKVFTDEEERELVDEVQKGVKAKKPMTLLQAQEKCQEIFAKSQKESREQPTFCRDFIKRVLNDKGLKIQECILGPGDTHISWLVKYGMT